MKKPFRVVLRALSITLLAVAATSNAATVRGRLEHVYPNGSRTPVSGIAVTIFVPATRIRSTPSYSGPDGMYYLEGIPAGTYNLEVWVSRDARVPPMVFTIQVQEPHSDIPPIYF